MPGDGDAVIKPSATKVPMPRQLGDEETMESLQHWKVTFRNYFRRDDYFNVFLPSDVQWNPAEANYGLQAETTGLKREAAVLKNDLVAFLETIAGFLPHSYVTERILKNTTCLKDVWNVIAELYEAEISSDTFMDLAGFSKLPNESFRQFFERLVDHVQKHLTKPNIKLENYDSGATGDKMNLTMLNLMVLQWLQKIDPKLVQIVRVEYSADLKDGKQLYELMPRVAKCIPQLLARHESHGVKLIQDRSANEFDEEAQVSKVNVKSSKVNFKSTKTKQKKSQFHCAHCEFLNKILKATIPTDHDPDKCNRKSVAIRQIQQESDDDDEESVSGKSSPKTSSSLTPLSFQSSCQVPETVRDRLGVDILPCDVLSNAISSSQCLDNSLISDLEAKIRSITKMPSNASKAKSPSFLGLISSTQVIAVVDEGAEINVLDKKIADLLCLEVTMTPKLAKAAGGSQLSIVGQSATPLVLEALTAAGKVPINLGNVIVVDKLGCDVLVGEPAKGENNIITIPSKKLILFSHKGKTVVEPYLNVNKAGDTYAVGRVSKKTTLYPGDSYTLPLPQQFYSCQHVAVNPRMSDEHWYTSGVYNVSNGHVSLLNTSSIPVTLKRGQHIGEVRMVQTNINLVNAVVNSTPSQLLDDLPEPRQFQHEGRIKDEHSDYLDQVHVDPDHQLSDHDRDKFKKLLEDFSDIITPIPGRYNGNFGMIDNSIHFVDRPAPVTKVYQPRYTDEMKLLLAKKMDQLFDWGCLAYPEDIGVQTLFVSPSMLVPKQEKNEFRMVTDFGALNRYIRKKPTAQPTIHDVKKALAKAKFHCHLDLSNFFHQSGMKRQDCAYLGVQHPFKGVMVYTVEPQGLRNAGENSFEKLGRMLGDMIQEGKAARMADAVHALGNTVDELYENLKEILTRAKLSGFTFKPSKLIICPKKTTLFGWTLDGTKWSPNTHVITTLSKAELPSTVKMLRSFLGSFKQFVECVPKCAIILHKLELMVANKPSAEKLVWNDDMIEVFENAKRSTNDVQGVHIPIPTDKLYTFSDYSAMHKAIGGRLEIERMNEDGSTVRLNGGYFSATVDANRSKWLACEGESLAVRLVIEHFANYIRENFNTTIHYTDNLPTVFAWKKSLKGAYSTSPRISTFLNGLSAYTIDIQHKPGTTMNTSDYLSRHPLKCDDQKCRICQFVQQWTEIGDNCDQLRSITVTDVLNGEVQVPYLQRKAWIDVQAQDPIHSKLKHLIQVSQSPEPKKTCGQFTHIKQLHNLYKKGDLKITNDGLIEVKQHGQIKSGWVISVPTTMFAGLIQALHLRLSHPSKAQLTQVIQKFFYTPGYLSYIDQLYDNCHTCQSLKTLPKIFKPETTTPLQGFGTKFAADVIERCSQKILVVVECLTGFSITQLIPDQTTKTLDQALYTILSTYAHVQGCTTRTDGAPSWQSLHIQSRQQGSLWKMANFVIEIGDTLNKNKNPVCENKIKELEKEILKFKSNSGPITISELAYITRIMNARPRHRGNTSYELVFKRSQVDGSAVETSDTELSTLLHQSRLKANDYKAGRAKTSEEQPAFQPGDLVFVREDVNKNKSRERYIVTNVDNGTISINKFDNALRSKSYNVHPTQLIFAPYFRPGPSQNACNSESYELILSKQPKKSKLSLKSGKPTAKITLPKEPLKTKSTYSEDRDKSSKQGKGAPKNLEYSNNNGRPRREAAIKARQNWIKKVNLYMHKHGWDANQDFSDNFLDAMYSLYTDVQPPAQPPTPPSPTHSDHSSDELDPDANKFATPTSSPTLQPDLPQRSQHTSVIVGPSAPVQNLTQALLELQPPPIPPRTSTRASTKPKIDYRVLHSTGKINRN